MSKRRDSLTKTNNQLNQSNKELKEFNRVLSYDLKEPINSIVDFSQMASSPNVEKEKEKVNEYLELVISEGQQLQNLITSISTSQSSSNNN